MKNKIVLTGLALAAGLARGAEPDPVFDVPALAAAPIEARVLQSTEAEGIVTEEVRFFSEMDGTNRVEIFAIFCYPKGARALPALIWNQSGMAKASTYFPLLAARRGYAALCIDFPQAGYRSSGGYVINSGLVYEGDPKRAPLAHAVTALIRAVSFLQSRPEADPERIGMCGSSWGGFFTTLAMGVDSRLKAGSSMFGCGSLQDGCAWFYSKGQPPDAAYLEKWSRTFDPAFRLPGLTRPMAWFSGCNDHFYWFNALMATYAKPAGPKHLALLPNYDHGLSPVLDEQVFGWLDVYLKGAPPFIAVEAPRVEQKGGRPVFRWNWRSPVRRPASAEVALSFGKPGNWKTRYWKVLHATLGEDGVCEAPLPRVNVPMMVFGTVVETNGYRSSTAAVEVQAAAEATDPVAYNGCGMWGGFEEQEVAWLKGVGLLLKPSVTNDAHTGRQALVVQGKAGIATCVYYMAGRPHRFSLFAKSAEPAVLKITLNGVFDGQPKTWSVEAPTDPTWREISLTCTPPDCKAPNLGIEFETGGKPIALDTVTFQPMME